MELRSVYNKKRINPDEWVNLTTGETMDSAFTGLTSVNIKKDTLVEVKNDAYMLIDSNAMAYVHANFNMTEVGRIIKMSDMVKGCYNFLHDKRNFPHTKDTLMTELEYTRNIFADFMKKLYLASIISYMRSIINGKEVILIMLNPSLARKNKMFEKECLLAFQDLSKSEPQKIDSIKKLEKAKKSKKSLEQ